MLLNLLREKFDFIGLGSSGLYSNHLRRALWRHRKNRDLAFADAIGSATVELFIDQGNAQVAALRYYGLEDGMAVYDLGCGCGRTAQALQRAEWRGLYRGADVVDGLVAELKRKCPGYEAFVHRRPSLVADDSSLDLVFHWSVFTHIPPEDCYLYLEDTFRALRPGGKLVFSFLEMTEPQHYQVFESRVRRLRNRKRLRLPDTFLHRDWVKLWADKIGFADLRFTDGQEALLHPPMWQTVAAMMKPA
ncbi:MAG TPA: class I SAM-dependent methyltransferase [Sphingomicrobium sp.]|nr:class I SAM-dependent methyltransferase [Sphingomicrobium sp.]